MLFRAIFAAVAGVVACSSIPSVEFTDAPLDGGEGGAGPGSSGVSSGGTAEGGPACPENAPAKGLCCGRLTCVKCTNALLQCIRCVDAKCSSGEVCCGRPNDRIDCRKAKDCD